MINQKLFTIIGAGSRTVVRAALNSELYPVNGGDYEVQFSGVSILSGRLFGAYLLEENIAFGQPQVLAGNLRVYQNYVESYTDNVSFGQPQVLAGTLKYIVVNEAIEGLPVSFSGVTVLSGEIKDIVLNFNVDEYTVNFTGVTILSGSLG